MLTLTEWSQAGGRDYSAQTALFKDPVRTAQ